MNDLVSRQAAIDALEREKTYCTAFRDGYPPINVFEKYNTGLTDGIKALKNLPFAEPKRGKWKPFDLTWGRSVWACDACGETADVPTLNGKPIFDYCPWCGAKMERSEE